MKQPKLRFAGFDGDWQPCKLGDIAKMYSGGTPSISNKAYYGGEIPFIRSGEIYSDKTELFLSQEGFDKSSAKMVNKGDILYALYGATSGEVSRSLINGAINQAILAIIPNEHYESEFISQFLAGQKDKIISTYLQGGQGNLSGEIVKNLMINIPKDKTEQTTIGNFFRQIDDLITLHQRKLDHTKQLKKGLLQKLFPKNGQTVPEIRFDGFTDAWERCKLGDLSQKVKEKNKDKKFTETFTNSAEFGVISQRDFFDKEISNIENIDTYYIVQNDDFIYNPRISNLAPVGPIKRNKLGRTGVMSPLYYVFRLNSDVEPSFLESYFDTKIWHNFMYLNGDTGARSDRFAIKDSVFVEMPIMLPTLKEQTQIGLFFRQIDDLITLHQRKLDNLKLLKKALLQQMFV